MDLFLSSNKIPRPYLFPHLPKFKLEKKREKKKREKPTMASSSCFSLTKPVSTNPNAFTAGHNFKRTPINSLNVTSSRRTTRSLSQSLGHSIPLVASVAILFWSNPVNAGILSGSKGLESVPGPQLPQFDFLNRFNDENQKRYAEFDERIKTSPLLKEYLGRSKVNKEKNKQETLDKYCLRGAEWGVGDCSAEGMSAADRDSFIAMLKKKTGVE